MRQIFAYSARGGLNTKACQIRLSVPGAINIMNAPQCIIANLRRHFGPYRAPAANPDTNRLRCLGQLFACSGCLRELRDTQTLPGNNRPGPLQRASLRPDQQRRARSQQLGHIVTRPFSSWSAVSLALARGVWLQGGWPPPGNNPTACFTWRVGGLGCKRCVGLGEPGHIVTARWDKMTHFHPSGLRERRTVGSCYSRRGLR